MMKEGIGIIKRCGGWKAIIQRVSSPPPESLDKENHRNEAHESKYGQVFWRRNVMSVLESVYLLNVRDI